MDFHFKRYYSIVKQFSKNIIYESLLRRARINIGEFMGKTNFLHGGYTRILSKYRGKSYLTDTRYSYIVRELRR